VRINSTVYIVVGTTQFGLTIEEDLKLRDLQLRLYWSWVKMPRPLWQLRKMALNLVNHD